MHVVPRMLPDVLARTIVRVGAAVTAFTVAAFASAMFGASPLAIATTAVGGGVWGAILASRRSRIVTAILTLAGAATLLVQGHASAHPKVAFFVALTLPVLAALAILGIVRATDRARSVGALDSAEASGISIVAMVAAAAGLGLALSASRLYGVLALVTAVALSLFVLVRDCIRARFLRRVYAGEDAAFKITSSEELTSTFAELPPVFSGGVTGALLTFRLPVASYRGGHSERPVARCPAEMRDTLARLRARHKELALAFMLALGSLAVGSTARALPARPAQPTAVAAPHCVDARAYFAEKIPLAVPEVGRVALVTHAEDPMIAEGAGVVLLVPMSGKTITPSVKQHAVDVAQRIPCTGKLALTAEEPRYRRFDVIARITLDEGVDPAVVRRDADAAASDLFVHDSRRALTELSGFGADDHTFGWRVRYAIAQVHGVRRVSVTIDDEPTAALGARDFPELGTLTLLDAKDDEPLGPLGPVSP